MPVIVTTSVSHKEYAVVGGKHMLSGWSTVSLTTIYSFYFIAVAKGSVYPFVPMMSQTFASVPESGIFNMINIFLCIWGLINSHYVYMSIKIRMRRLEEFGDCRKVSVVSKVYIIASHLQILGLILIASYPLNFHRGTPQWLHVTAIPHAVGATLTALGSYIVVMCLTYNFSVLNPGKKLYGRLLIICLMTINILIMGYLSLHANFFGPIDVNKLKDCVIGRDDIPINSTYTIFCALQWITFTLYCILQYTVADELEKFNLSIRVSLNEAGEKSLKNEVLIPVKDETDSKRTQVNVKKML